MLAFISIALWFALFSIPTAAIYAAAILMPWPISSAFMTTPLDPLTLVSLGFVALFFFSIAKLTYRRSHDQIGRTVINRDAFFPSIPSLLYVQACLASAPFVALALDPFLASRIVNAGCADGTISPYFLLTLDSLFKGAFIDFAESFRIDFSACASEYAGFPSAMFIFLVRAFASYIVIFAVVKTFTRWRRDGFGMDYE